MAGLQWARRRAPEAALALVAVAVFLGFLGSVDLWGKREQRASAEAIDTIDHDRWLVAQIQGRPRLEKQPDATHGSPRGWYHGVRPCGGQGSSAGRGG